MQTPLVFFSAFIVVLLLIALATWLVRKFGGSRLGNNAARGRAPRLAVLDATAVDTRRRLVLVRRDNVEHLLMIGGPTDIVVESSIIRSAAGRDQAGRPDPSRQLDAAILGEADTQAEPALPELPVRPPSRSPSFNDELRRSAPPVAPVPPAAERRAEPAPAPETALRPEPRIDTRPEPRLDVRPEPRLDTPPAQPSRANLRPDPASVRPAARGLDGLRALGRAPEVTTGAPAAAPSPASPSLNSKEAVNEADENLAAMAQRLEAALRRPAVDPSQRAPAPAAASGSSGPAPEWPGTPRPAPRVEPAPNPSIKSGFENLEDEMASLLGRPKNPS